MKYPLKWLLLLVTIVGVLVAWGVRIANHREKVALHQAAFSEAKAHVNALDNDLLSFVMSIPEIAEQLSATSPMNPEMALGKTMSGHSHSFGRPEFGKKYHLHWQLANGQRTPGVKLQVFSQRSEDVTEDHLIQISYIESPWNHKVATWLKQQLDDLEQVRIEERIATQEIVARRESEPAAEPSLDAPASTYGGVY